MARNEDGEFEMVLGNRQLLSIFFIVVILLAVFFTMGYLMGRGSGAAPTLAQNVPADIPGAPKPDATPAGSEVPANPAGTAPQEQHPTDLAPGQAVVSTVPAAAPEVPPAQAPPQEAGAKPPAAKPAEPPAPAVPQNGDASGPLAGNTYLQVAATSRTEAELEVEVLRKRGLPALMAPVPNGTAFRVLVGPMKDSAHVAKTKLDLEDLGFKQIFIRKY